MSSLKSPHSKVRVSKKGRPLGVADHQLESCKKAEFDRLAARLAAYFRLHLDQVWFRPNPDVGEDWGHVMVKARLSIENESHMEWFLKGVISEMPRV